MCVCVCGGGGGRTFWSVIIMFRAVLFPEIVFG
jgi:hypothetical protein